jgi:molybdopterin-guanine dinucleotide biosynthesis protein A
LDRSAIVLAGGYSSRFGEDKGLVKLAGKPLLSYVVDAVRGAVDEVVVVTSSTDRTQKYRLLVHGDVRFAVDSRESEGPLIGALTGFGVALGKYALVLPFDTPFVSKEVAALLFDLCVGRSAVIPRWPNGQIEPLHAVYEVNEAKATAEAALAGGRLDMRGMIERLRRVRFVSTLVVMGIDPELQTFFNINTPSDLTKAEAIIKLRKSRVTRIGKL